MIGQVETKGQKFYAGFQGKVDKELANQVLKFKPSAKVWISI